LLERAERLAELPHQEGGDFHPYRRAWASGRKDSLIDYQLAHRTFFGLHRIDPGLLRDLRDVAIRLHLIETFRVSGGDGGYSESRLLETLRSASGDLSSLAETLGTS
jgi:hypothetical protein